MNDTTIDNKQRINSFMDYGKYKISKQKLGKYVAKIYAIDCCRSHFLYKKLKASLWDCLSIKNKQATSALFNHQRQKENEINFITCRQITSIQHYEATIEGKTIVIQKRSELN